MSDESVGGGELPGWQVDLISWFDRTFDLRTRMGSGPMYLVQQAALKRGSDPPEGRPVVEYSGFEDDSLCSELKHVMDQLKKMRRPYYEWRPWEWPELNDRSAAIAEVVQARVPEALQRGYSYQRRRLESPGSLLAQALKATEAGTSDRLRKAVSFVAMTTTSTLVKKLVSDRKILQNIRSESLLIDAPDLDEGY